MFFSKLFCILFSKYKRNIFFKLSISYLSNVYEFYVFLVFYRIIALQSTQDDYLYANSFNVKIYWQPIYDKFFFSRNFHIIIPCQTISKMKIQNNPRHICRVNNFWCDICCNFVFRANCLSKLFNTHWEWLEFSVIAKQPFENYSSFGVIFISIIHCGKFQCNLWCVVYIYASIERFFNVIITFLVCLTFKIC